MHPIQEYGLPLLLLVTSVLGGIVLYIWCYFAIPFRALFKPRLHDAILEGIQQKCRRNVEQGLTVLQCMDQENPAVLRAMAALREARNESTYSSTQKEVCITTHFPPLERNLLGIVTRDTDDKTLRLTIRWHFYIMRSDWLELMILCFRGLLKIFYDIKVEHIDLLK